MSINYIKLFKSHHLVNTGKKHAKTNQNTKKVFFFG